MYILNHTLSAGLSLEQVIAALSASPLVDGIALFGSRAGKYADNPISDYDLLLLVNDLPVPIFQMFTHIGGRMADLVFVEAAAVDHILTQAEPVAPNSFEGMQLQKMLTAQIVYDASGRLERLQQHARQHGNMFLPVDENTIYDTCFWPNHALVHMKRMAQSDDPAYLTAVDMMLMGCLSTIGRAYFQVRDLRWEGEKAAVRYWQVHDPDYLQALRECIAEPDRQQKLTQYEALIRETLAPVAPLWQGEVSAVYLRDTPHTEANLRTALDFWEGLFK